jgi:mono/diheme cytochrome c family protein
MKTQTLTLLSAAIVALGAVASATAKTTPAPNPAALDAADGAFLVGGRGQFGETSGEAMYRRVCAACHMPDAKGADGAGRYPSLAKNANLEAGGYPLTVLMKGLNGMPPVGRMMTDQQAADVVNYVRSNFGNRYKDAITAEDAKAAR